MISLFVNGYPELLGSLPEIQARIATIKAYDPTADIEKRDPERCGACQSPYFDLLEALSCPCHDDY